MKSIALRLASVGLVVGAFALAFPSQAGAAELDCTAGCSLATLPFASFGGIALFSTGEVHPAGNGVFEPFVRIQDKDMESGHNTSGTLVDDEKGGTWTHDLQMNQIPVKAINGVSYYEFMLDVDEDSGHGSLIALNNVQICVGDSPGMTGATVTTGSGNHTDVNRSACPGTLKYSFGAFDSEANDVLLDYDLIGKGNGSSDLFMYIPVATLGPSSTKYLYLFSQFGLSDPPAKTDAGYESWAVRSCYPNCGVVINPLGQVPEPSSLLLLGAGVLGLAAAVRRRAAKA